MARSKKPRARRRGLAPLELVMAIPLLMFALALSVIIGAVACWKVRAEVVARDAIFSRRWPRNDPPDPMPVEWRVPNATRTDLQGPQLTELDHPVFQDPLIRGPLPGIGVNNEMLDPKNHERIGNSALTRSPAALGKLGAYRLNVQVPLLDGKWQFWQLGYATNEDRRLRRLYDLLKLPAGLDEKAKYQQAMQETTTAYWKPAAAVLDRDEELHDWFHRYLDFHPRLPRFCSIDADDVRQRYVERHIPRIDSRPRPSNPAYNPPGVPETMTRAFLRMYRAQLAILEKIKPLSPAQQQQMLDLQQKIGILKAFLAALN